ncbi:hypothetical protein [uncultured Cytophaga sp.]|uniref:hypothetical protein n=1 Tax=uncultured Cytophaga sp. TaxID=160238 RepID=UPI002625C03C|nr:hypothetical protein [uncultured Cytophaga sp.]
MVDIEEKILESRPYIDSFEFLQKEDSFYKFLIPNSQDFYNDNVSILIKRLALLGSYSIAMEFDIDEKIVCLGSYLVLNKINFENLLTSDKIEVKIRPQFKGKRTALMYCEVFSEKTLVYTFKLECTIMNEALFKNRFKHFEAKTNPACLDHEYTNRFNKLSDTKFEIYLDRYAFKNCDGHFKGIPIVPAVEIIEKIFFHNKQWITEEYNKKEFILKEMLAFADLPLSPATSVTICTDVKSFKNNYHMFTSIITDNEGNHYGTYNLTFKI